MSAGYRRCPCGGTYTARVVQVTMPRDRGEAVTVPGLPQGGCPDCESRVYKANVLAILEELFRGVQARSA